MGWGTNDGVYLGFQIDEPLDEPDSKSRLDVEWNVKDSLNEYGGPRHLLTIGPNGSGKTRKLLVPNLHRLTDWSTVVIDPKGELAVWTARHRKEAGNEIITIDPFRVIERRYPGLVQKYPYLRSAGVNPIAALNPQSEDFPDDAKAIGEALIKVEGQDKYWAKSAQALICGLVMALALQGKTEPEKGNLGRLRRLIGLAPEELANWITARIKDYGEDYPAMAAKLGRFTKMADENREMFSILSTAVTNTDWLDSGPIADDLKKGSANFAFLKTRPCTIYLVLPPRYLESHATWLRLMITIILMPLIRSTGGKVPVLFMLDEFAQLGHLEVIERNMALMRGYGVKLWAILQDLSQLKDSYEKRWESFIANAGVIQSFAPQDVTTREYLAKLSGQRLYWMETTGRTTSKQQGAGGFSQSTSEQGGMSHIQAPVFLEQSLAQMSEEQSVLFPAGYKPRRTWLPDPAEERQEKRKLPKVCAMLKSAAKEAAEHEVAEA